VVAALFKAGAQLPVMPLVDVVGSAAKAAPEHIGATAVKVGVIFGLTVIVKVVVGSTQSCRWREGISSSGCIIQRQVPSFL